MLTNPDDAQENEVNVSGVRAKKWGRLLVDVNIKADVEEGEQDEDFGVKLEEEEEDNVQPIQEIRLDCKEEEEEEVVGEEGDGVEESLLFDADGTEDNQEETLEFEFDESMIELIDKKDNDDDEEEDVDSSFPNPLALEGSHLFTDEPEEIQSEDSLGLSSRGSSADEGHKSNGVDGKRHQRVDYEEDSEEEDDTSRDPDYNVNEEEGFSLRRKRVSVE